MVVVVVEVRVVAVAVPVVVVVVVVVIVVELGLIKFSLGPSLSHLFLKRSHKASGPRSDVVLSYWPLGYFGLLVFRLSGCDRASLSTLGYGTMVCLPVLVSDRFCVFGLRSFNSASLAAARLLTAALLSCGCCRPYVSPPQEAKQQHAMNKSRPGASGYPPMAETPKLALSTPNIAERLKDVWKLPMSSLPRGAARGATPCAALPSDRGLRKGLEVAFTKS